MVVRAALQRKEDEEACLRVYREALGLLEE
jgi:hypothetical protein